MSKISHQKVIKNSTSFTIANTLMGTIPKVTERILIRQQTHFNRHSTAKTHPDNQEVRTLTIMTFLISLNLAINLQTQTRVGKST